MFDKVHFPSAQDVQDLQVGDIAIDSAGRQAEVMRIVHKEPDARGDAFVCYDTKTGSTSTCSMSFKANRLTHASVLQLNNYDHSQLEDCLRKARGCPSIR